ncbi:MAG TPA: DUF4359 domain-containing protein [Candidatus Obscuribacterales bacterium]
MKGTAIVTAIGGIALVGLGAAMALTNPSQDDYEEYAAQTLTTYLKENVCPKAPKFLGNSLGGQCSSLVDSNQSEIKQLVTKGTQQQNFILFSVYKTNLSMRGIVPFFPASVLPSYHFETVGVFNDFYTYQAQKQ